MANRTGNIQHAQDSDVYYQTNDIKVYDDFEDMPMFTDNLTDSMESLLRGIMSYGFQKPSRIQERGIVPLYNGKNLIAQSQSGTGKTGTFVIGTLSRFDPTLDKVQIVVIAPTHELATQTHHVYCEIAKYMFKDHVDRNGKTIEGSGVKRAIALCVGKQISPEDNIRSIRNGASIIIGTPGRIFHMVDHRSRDGEPLIHPKYCKVLILDEADKLLTSKDAKRINTIVEILDNGKMRNDYLQLGIFSATFNSEETLNEARRLCMPDFDKLVEDGVDWASVKDAPYQILLKPDKLTLDGILQYYFDLGCDDPKRSFAEKAEFIVTLNQERMIPTSIIYVNNSETAEKLKYFLNDRGLVCDCIYGSLSSLQRLEITDQFRTNKLRILISTDLLARGFDVRQVALVINFDLPYVYDCREGAVDQQKVADYLHRIGRSGRFGRKGVAINLVSTSRDRTRKDIIEERYNIAMRDLPDDVSEIY